MATRMGQFAREQAVAMYSSGMTTWQVADGLSVSQGTIARLIRNAGLTRRGAGRIRFRTPELFAQNFWKRVDKRGECWRWTGAHNANGYAVVGRNRKVEWAHRIAWELTQGEPPQGLDLDHRCRNCWCVNPAHLEPVSHAENVRRGRATKLSVGDARDIRGRYDAGDHGITAMAKQYGVTKRHILMIARRQSWREHPD